MFRYYMTPETQRALIAESNRQIANRASNAYRRQLRNAGSDGAAAPAPASNEDDWAEESVSDSAFARLVADLQTTPPVRLAEHA